MKGGTKNMIRKGAVQIAVPALLVCIALNAYLVVDHLRQMQKMATLTLESSMMQASISAVLNDLTDMETGQRGYLLTNDPSYLQPYTAGKNRIETHLATLRAKLANRTAGERSLDSQLESLIKSKQVEMERTIDLRQRGYRHRSFTTVATNEGKDYMDEARRVLSSLSSAESSNFVRFDTERTVTLKKVLSATIATNCGLLVLAAFLFGLIRYDGRLLAEESAQSRRVLSLRDSQLAKLTAALSGQARFNISALNTNSRLLLENYGGFLPRQGHEYAEQMKEAATQMERLRQDLVGSRSSDGDWKAA
jgi:CHASE3 domain sensor protein